MRKKKISTCADLTPQIAMHVAHEHSEASPGTIDQAHATPPPRKKHNEAVRQAAAPLRSELSHFVGYIRTTAFSQVCARARARAHQLQQAPTGESYVLGIGTTRGPGPGPLKVCAAARGACGGRAWLL